MALSNAERQKLHRQRVKVRLADAGAVTENAILRAVTDYISDPEWGAQVSAEEWFADFRKESQGGAAAALIPVVYDALGLPADPWPGLTVESLKKMIGRRENEAHKRGLMTTFPIDTTLTRDEKFMALRNREWLEGPKRKRAAA
jgi:hypothetical protein